RVVTAPVSSSLAVTTSSSQRPPAGAGPSCGVRAAAAATTRLTWPRSSSRARRMASTATSVDSTTAASVWAPRTAATAVSYPCSTVSASGSAPRSPATRSAASSRAPVPSLRARESSRVSRRVCQVQRSESAARSASTSAATAASAARRDRPGEPGQAPAAVGHTAVHRGEGTFGLPLGLLRAGPLGDDGLQRRAGGRDLRGERLLLLAGAGGAGLELLGVGAAVLLGGGAEQPGALGRQRVQPPQPLPQTGQRVPGVGRLAQPRGLGGGLRLEGGQPLPGGVGGGLDGGAPLTQRGLVGDLPLEGGAQLDEVVGQQPGAGVVEVGLDHLGAAGDVGLLGQRPELAADLAGEIGEPVDVGPHR